MQICDLSVSVSLLSDSKEEQPVKNTTDIVLVLLEVCFVDFDPTVEVYVMVQVFLCYTEMCAIFSAI